MSRLTNKPLVSIIITTKNEKGVLERSLKSIKNQSYGRIEIIVVDNKSSDKTKEIAKKFTKRVYDFGPERSAQRNFGAKKAKGKYFLFLDADMELSKKVVQECVYLTQKDEKIGAVVIPEESVAMNFWEKVKAFERSFYNLQGDELTDAARFFRKDVFLRVGGYDEKITGPEDWDLTERLKQKGYKIGIVFSKIFHHERIPGLFSLVKKKYYYALKSHRYFAKQKISPISAKTVYFLRPVFYRNWRRLLTHPFLASGMFIMFGLEMIGGGLGFVVGYSKKS